MSGTSHADAREQVLTRVQRHLNLRHDVPEHRLAAHELARREQLHHRRPRSPERALHEGAARGDAPERLALSLLGVERQLDAGLRMKEAVPREHLAERHERLEDRCVLAEPGGLVASRELELARGREDGPAFQAVRDRALEADRDIARAARPDVLGVLRPPRSAPSASI